MLDGFLKYLSTQKRYSAKTIENYNLDLTNFINFFDGKDIRKLEYDDFRNYLEYMYNNKYASKTISRHISSLKSFYKYLLNNNYIKENPTLLLSSPKQEFRLPNYLNPIELEKIMETPDTSTIIGKRDILILEMFYATGIRLAELINIKVSDIDKSNRMIKILGKGSKERYVFFTTKFRMFGSISNKQNDCKRLRRFFTKFNKIQIIVGKTYRYRQFNKFNRIF